MSRLQEILIKIGRPDFEERNKAIRELAVFPPDDYMPFLTEALRNHEDAILRNGAMEALKAIDRASVPYLLRALSSDSDGEARLFSANVLGEIGREDGLDGLIEALRDPDVNVRVASAEALGKIGSPKAIDALKGALNDYPWVTMAAIDAIARIGGEAAIEILHACLDMDDYKGMTIEAIERAGNRKSIRKLTPYMESGEMKEIALKVIVNIAVREGIRPEAPYFMNHIPMLMELIDSPHSDLRKAAFIALSWSDDIRGLSPFIKNISDDDLQEYAIKGLLGLGRKTVPAIVDALRDKTRQQRFVLARILQMMGESMALVQFAGDPDPDVRVEVALGMGRLGTPKSASVLDRLSEDPVEEVSEAAKKALESFKK